MDSQRTDHFLATLYSDGSGPTFAMLLGRDRKYTGCNERLYESYKRWGKNLLGHRGAIIHSKTATTLEYRREGKYLLINGDLGRAHYPQPWAAKILPAISMDRFRAWFETGEESFLMYHIPRGHFQQVTLASDYMVLLTVGWAHSCCGSAHSAADFHKLLKGVGFDLVTRKDVTEIIASFNHGVLSKGGVDSPAQFEEHAYRPTGEVLAAIKAALRAARSCVDNQGHLLYELMKDGKTIRVTTSSEPDLWGLLMDRV